MKSVMIFDDRPNVRDKLAVMVSRKGFEPYECSNIHEADSLWYSKGNKIDALILDIMMPPRGLEMDLLSKTRGGLLTGWIWLWNHIKKSKIDTHPNKDFCTIIFTGYADDLNEYISTCKNNQEIEYFHSMHIFSKGDSYPEKKILQLLISQE